MSKVFDGWTSNIARYKACNVDKDYFVQFKKVEMLTVMTHRNAVILFDNLG